MPVPSEDDVKQLSANTDPDEFLRDLGQMAGMMGMNGGSDEAAKLAQAFKLSESLTPGTAPTADSMAQMNELLESSPFLKSKVRRACRPPPTSADLRRARPSSSDLRWHPPISGGPRPISAHLRRWRRRCATPSRCAR